MRHGLKITLALAFVGAVAMGAVAFGEHGSFRAGVDRGPALDGGGLVRQRVAADGAATRHRRFGRLGRAVVHGDLKIALPNGEFGTLTIDTGTITKLDDGAKTLTLKRADGETVTVTAVDKTRIRRNGERSTFAALKVGDHVRIVQVDRGEGDFVRLIGAHAPGTRDRAAATGAAT